MGGLCGSEMCNEPENVDAPHVVSKLSEDNFRYVGLHEAIKERVSEETYGIMMNSLKQHKQKL